MYFQSNPIATALKDLENRNERALYANWKPLQIINNRMALLFRHNASEYEHTLLYVHHFIFHPLHRLTDVGRILRTFKIKKNVEVTDNGKIII